MECQTHQTQSTVSSRAKADNLFKNRKVFNDPIHGQVELHPVCVRIIDTPQFQLLRHIKQLDTCYLVYPGACHNRFEHSIGVCFLAGKLMRTIRDRQPDEEISEIDILCVEIAGLCHDLGQGPYSHVFEKRFMPTVTGNTNFTHEETAQKMFEYMLIHDGGRLKKDIQEILEKCQMEKLTELDFTFISEMIYNQNDIEKREWPFKGRGEDKSYMYEIVANKRNGIDVDKWDYIARDSYMLGMKVNFDYNRCFTSARVIKTNGINGSSNGSSSNAGQLLRKQICYRDKEAPDLYDMFYTRLTLHRRAYQHKTHKIIGMMICDALVSANESFKIRGKRISETVDDMNAFTSLTDDVVQMILSDTDNNDLKEARKILEDIIYRRLYKRVSQTQCKVKDLKEKDVTDGIGSALKKKNMQDGFFCCDIVKLNYGMEDKSPLEKVRFYTKDNLDESIKLTKNQVSYVLPDVFEESIIRIYCKVKDDSDEQVVKNIRTAFAAWCKEKGYPDPKGPSNSQTDVKQRDDSSATKFLPEPAPLENTEQPPSTYDIGGIDIRVEGDS